MDFPGGPMVKNLPTNAGDTGSIPGPGRSHTSQSNQARAPWQLTCALEPRSRNYWAHAPRACAPQQEKGPAWSNEDPV